MKAISLFKYLKMLLKPSIGYTGEANRKYTKGYPPRRKNRRENGDKDIGFNTEN